jgi:PAS domain S-box-containing protein
VDSLKANLDGLEEENRRLRAFLESKTGRTYEQLLADPDAVANHASSAATSSSSGRGAGRGGGGAAAAAAAAAAASSASSAASEAGSVESSSDGGRSSGGGSSHSLLAGPGKRPSTMLDGSDYLLVEALTKSQQNFVVSDPNLPDNPIVFASHGFYDLTGFTAGEVLGRNCRFLQGPATDPEAVNAIRRGIYEGRDTAVCLINYKKDGHPFWNRFFVAPLRGVDGRIVNFVGVQCEVKEPVARMLLAAQKGKAQPDAALPPPRAPYEHPPSSSSSSSSSSSAAASSSSSKSGR